MGKFVINGGIPLFGRVNVSGSKNSALPLIFASLTVRGVSRIHGLPDIGDVRIALEIIRAYGAKITQCGEITEIDTRELKYTDPPAKQLCLLRASTYLMGAGLVRFGKGRICEVGGCNFSARPIDMHLDAVRAFGGVVSGCDLSLNDPHGAHIRFMKRSVGATVNALIMAASIEGESVIDGAAVEPHIMDLVAYLRSAGAVIEQTGASFIVRGAELHGAEVAVRGDMIEAGTYIAASLISGGRVKVCGVDITELEPFLSVLAESGAECSVHTDGITVTGALDRPVSIITAPYPGFPTDLQPIIAPLLARSGGKITDTVWRDRLGYLDELGKFGIASRRLGDGAEVFASEIHSATASSPDLRGGMALVLAALSSDGVSVIDSAETVLRGYEKPVEKLRVLGAEIKYRE